MNAAQRIQAELHKIMSDGEASACAVYKGYDYDGTYAGYAWWYHSFNQGPVWLGESVTEALQTIGHIRDEKEQA